MTNRKQTLRACLFGAALAFTAGFAGKARASDPLPGDAVAPPVNVNIGLIYNQYNEAGAIGALRGSTYSKGTHISTDITVLRYIRTFEVSGVEAGVQIYEPYIGFLGKQSAGVASTPLGAAEANLSHTSGFGQPNIGAFFWPINKPASGTYLVVAPWISPPISSFNKSSNLNPGNNTWVYEMELGFRTILFGTPKTNNLSVSMWGEFYDFGDNTNSAANSPEVNANNIPFPASLFVTNPIQPASSTPATFHEQTSEEFRIYFPYQFFPKTAAFIAPGFYQSFGGKQTYTIHANGAKVDSGNRTEESQLRLVAGSFVSPTMQILLVGGYDIANHGGPLNRSFEIRIAKFF